jgi:hypothetical protein
MGRSRIAKLVRAAPEGTKGWGGGGGGDGEAVRWGSWGERPAHVYAAEAVVQLRGSGWGLLGGLMLDGAGHVGSFTEERESGGSQLTDAVAACERRLTHGDYDVRAINGIDVRIHR